MTKFKNSSPSKNLSFLRYLGVYNKQYGTSGMPRVNQQSNAMNPALRITNMQKQFAGDNQNPNNNCRESLKQRPIIGWVIA